MKIISLFLAVLFGSLTCSLSQQFSTQTGFSDAATNVLSPISVYGTLFVDYDFQGVPDTMDVYYDSANIFSSGLVSGAGQFVIPYGPGISTSITIIMNEGGGNIGTAWQYTPTVEAVPEPKIISLFGLGFLAMGFGVCRKYMFAAPSA